jgi:DNA-binding NarL/FixJ family response regulator
METPMNRLKAIRVMIVDDNQCIRDMLKEVLELEGNFLITGEAEDREQALKEVPRVDPDIVLIDVSLDGGEGGLELVQELRARGIRVPVIILSLHEKAIYENRAHEAGAQGYVMKQEGPDKIAEAIRTVLARERSAGLSGNYR